MQKKLIYSSRKKAAWVLLVTTLLLLLFVIHRFNDRKSEPHKEPTKLVPQSYANLKSVNNSGKQGLGPTQNTPPVGLAKANEAGESKLLSPAEILESQLKFFHFSPIDSDLELSPNLKETYQLSEEEFQNVKKDVQNMRKEVHDFQRKTMVVVSNTADSSTIFIPPTNMDSLEDRFRENLIKSMGIDKAMVFMQQGQGGFAVGSGSFGKHGSAVKIVPSPPGDKNGKKWVMWTYSSESVTQESTAKLTDPNKPPFGSGTHANTVGINELPDYVKRLTE